MKINKKYYIFLVGRIWKIIPMFEENKINCFKYMYSLYIELSGNDDNLQEIIQIRRKINGLIKEKDNIQHNIVKSTIFDCINLLDKMLSNWGD